MPTENRTRAVVRAILRHFTRRPEPPQPFAVENERTEATTTPDIRARDLTTARMLAAHRPEMELLAQIGGRPRIIGTGGECLAIEADAGPAADPLGTIYLLITTEDHYLATDRAAITKWTVCLYDAADDDRAISYADGPTFLEAYRGAWAAFRAGDIIE